MGSQRSKTSAADLVAKPTEEKELGPAALCARMQESLTTGTRYRSPIKKFPKCFTCFTGHEAVDWMLSASGREMPAKLCANARRCSAEGSSSRSTAPPSSTTTPSGSTASQQPDKADATLSPS
ncbi:hypothetical protein PHYSODRAFT_321081 [Phytophthora sojae]|uniref:DEP domain-containing protein n=1 Tax=Phytophthora sojae (strain P6497) TaxID=1094619 RepID=G4YPB5_PHYSP|nr:hypothetical protein PHYSODRAFT_321081 [Phytophthora sojae]EGZ27249.1 hypothetical protein PHYSODRAFT_321081 [Phytophthora sojae]|eukprot:XP_009514524.1 hypothetical protein PHYSODRAFT_321081 [Phytophthora sojae]